MKKTLLTFTALLALVFISSCKKDDDSPKPTTPIEEDTTEVYTGPNRAPVAVNDIYKTVSGETITFNPIDNDYDLDGDSIYIHDFYSVNGSTKGTFIVNIGRSLTYTSNYDFVGTDGITYNLVDTKGGEVVTGFISIEVSDTIK